MKAVIYARYSSNRQNEESIKRQHKRHNKYKENAPHSKKHEGHKIFR